MTSQTALTSIGLRALPVGPYGYAGRDGHAIMCPYRLHESTARRREFLVAYTPVAWSEACSVLALPSVHIKFHIVTPKNKSALCKGVIPTDGKANRAKPNAVCRKLYERMKSKTSLGLPPVQPTFVTKNVTASLIQAYHVSRQVYYTLSQSKGEWNTMLPQTGLCHLSKNQKMKCVSDLYHAEEGLLRNITDKVLPRCKDLVKLLESEVTNKIQCSDCINHVNYADLTKEPDLYKMREYTVMILNYAKLQSHQIHLGLKKYQKTQKKKKKQS